MQYNWIRMFYNSQEEMRYKLFIITSNENEMKKKRIVK